ncbi:MAG: SGNH/GDSL hydrolase family protein, partial [bacterium]
VIIGEILVRTSGVCETWWEKNVAWWQQNTAWWKKNKNNYISPYAEPSNKTWYWVRTPNAKTNYKLAEFEYPVVTNSLGLRDVEPALARPENEFYLITLGDSFTEGFGAEYESSYPKWLERNLREKCAPLHVRVINGGVCGSDPFYSFTLLRDKLLPYQPNLVTVAINSSDITDLIVRGGEERFLENGGVKFVEPPQDEWLFAGSHLYRLLKRSLGYDWLGLSPSELMAKKERAVNDLIVALGKFNALAMKEHFVFVAILHPANRFEALSQRYSFDANALKRYMEENQIQYVDLMSAFADKAKMGESEVNKLYWQQDGHNNAEGYRIMAEALAAYILDHKLLSSCLTADETVLMSNHF